MKATMDGRIERCARAALTIALAVALTSTPALAGDEIPPLQAMQAAADAGDAKAETALGYRYPEGSGVVRDVVKAAAWFREAAKQGHAPAQTMLGYMYDKGIAVAKDEENGLAWYCAAAIQGHRRAQANLEIMHTYGLFDPQQCAVLRPR